MSQRVAIFFAQAAEARATIAALKAEPVVHYTRNIWTEGEQIACYLFERGRIVLTGMGIHGAQMGVAEHAAHFDIAWNLGLAATLNTTLPINSLVSIQHIDKHCLLPEDGLDPGSQNCLESILPHLTLPEENGARLISCDYPIHHEGVRNSLASNWDLLDMEGYGIAYASRVFNKECRMWKIVSDFASPGGRELIRKNKPRLCENLAEFIIQKLEEL